jgi:twitching motility protein PilT
LPCADRLAKLLIEAAERGASDLLLVAGAPPTVYTFGQWVPLSDHRLTSGEVSAFVEPILTEVQQAQLRDRRDLDFGMVLPAQHAETSAPPGCPARYRVNVHYQRGTMAAAFRAIPGKVPPFEQLGLPPEVRRLADFPNGLVLVTGCTGQGKSTTLAAIVDHMNRTRSAHVITIEDPIEFSFEHGTCLIEQRQIGEDSPSFASALRHVLRQRPDVILIGEMRDLETIATALTAAETGHLVLGSLHTASAAQTLARIIDVFPPVQQIQVRTQLAASLKAIVCQTLVRDQANETLTPATEILMATSGVRRAIRDNETHLIYAMIETGRSQGMHTLEQSLAALVKSGRVGPEEAFAAAIEPVRLAKLTGRTEKVVVS